MKKHVRQQEPIIVFFHAHIDNSYTLQDAEIHLHLYHERPLDQNAEIYLYHKRPFDNVRNTQNIAQRAN